MEYTVIIEKAADGFYSAYVPDLPGCVACGDSVDEVKTEIREALNLHLESMRQHGEAIPPPSSEACTIPV